MKEIELDKQVWEIAMELFRTDNKDFSYVAE